jgi:glycine cleavage system aminomethyltransferase T
VIVRVMHRGQGRVAKKLVGLQLAGGDLPLAKTTIASGDRDIGRVTSAVWSPTLERAVALGYVHRDFTDPGTTVIVKSAPSPIEATVVTLPFVPAIVGPLSLQS